MLQRVQRRSRALLPTKSFVALLAAAAALLAIVGLSYRSLEARERAARAVNRANDVQLHLQRVLSLLKDAETGQRGYLLTGVTQYLEPYEIARGRLPSELAELTRALAGEYREQTAELGSLATKKLEELAATVELERRGDHAQAVELVKTNRGKLTMDRIRVLTDEMLAREQSAASIRGAEWAESVTWSAYVTYGGSALLFAMLLLVGWLASRDFRAVEAESGSAGSRSRSAARSRTTTASSRSATRCCAD